MRVLSFADGFESSTAPVALSEFEIQTSSGPKLTIKDTGTAGIDADPYIRFMDGAPSEMGYLGFTVSNSLNMYLQNLKNGALIFGANNTNFLTLNTDGSLALRRDHDGNTLLQVRNDNTGSNAAARFAVSSDQGDFNIYALSGAGGDYVSLISDSTFSNGLLVGTLGTNPLRLRTNNTDQVTVRGTGIVAFTTALKFANMSSTTRDALTPESGFVIYNTTTSKLQVYSSGSWVDLH